MFKKMGDTQRVKKFFEIILDLFEKLMKVSLASPTSGSHSSSSSKKLLNNSIATCTQLADELINFSIFEHIFIKGIIQNWIKWQLLLKQCS